MGNSEPLAIVKGLAGAIVGGLLGYIIFRWMLNNWSVYAIVLIGAGISLGFAYFYGRPSLLFGILCGVTALVANLAANWSVSHTTDGLLQHTLELPQQPMIYPIMILLGGFFGFWFGRGRRDAGWNRDE